MSLELEITKLNASIVELIAVLKAQQGGEKNTVKTPNVTPAVTPTATVTVTPTQVVTAPPVPVVASPSDNGMPPIPVFTAPPLIVSAAAPTAAPFSDSKGLLEYVMKTYKDLGPTKGMGIQGVLTTLGVTNINQVQPDQYLALYTGIEELK